METKKERVATRKVDGVVWTSQKHGRWSAEIDGVPVQIDAAFFRTMRTGWMITVRGEYKNSYSSMEQAMHRAAEYAAKEPKS